MSAKLEALRQDLKKQYEELEDERATVDLFGAPRPANELEVPRCPPHSGPLDGRSKQDKIHANVVESHCERATS